MGLKKHQRSPTSFLKESYIGSIRFILRFHHPKDKTRKSEDNSDRKPKHYS